MADKRYKTLDNLSSSGSSDTSGENMNVEPKHIYKKSIVSKKRDFNLKPKISVSPARNKRIQPSPRTLRILK